MNIGSARADPYPVAMQDWRPTRESWLVAGVCGLWAAVFLAPEDPTALLAVPLCVLGVAGLRRFKTSAAMLVVLADLVCGLTGVTYGNVDMLGAITVTLFTLGRMVERIWVGPLITVALAVTSAMRDTVSVKNIAVSCLVYGSMWVFGRIVRHRAIQARHAVAESDRLARENPAQLSAQAVAAEKGRLAGDALLTLADAVVDMRATAAEALEGLDPGRITQIRTSGAAAVHQLRELLGILREIPARTVESADEVMSRARRRPTGQLATLAYAAVSLLAALLPPHWSWSAAMLGLYLTMLVGIAIRRALPTTACLIVAVATAVVAASPPEDTDMLLPTSIGYALLAWTASGRTAWHTRVALTTLVAATVALAVSFGTSGVGYILVLYMCSVLARGAWDEKDQILRSAESDRGLLQAQLDQAIAAALQAERLHIARELHDVSSHAVGVMVLHAGAAEALRIKAPDQAREALQTVMEAGAEALTEIDDLRTMLGTSQPDDPSRPGENPEELRRVLHELIDRRSKGELLIEARLGELPHTPELAQVTLRIVQEALTNAARHAPASRVIVEISRVDSRYVVRVSDDGPHQPATTEHTGFGLAGLAERVHACGGEFTAGPLPGRGFEVCGTLPTRPVRATP